MRSEQECVFVLRDGVRERDSYRNMSNTKQTKRVTPASRETLLLILETLPGALFVIDDAETIVYANASAQAMTGATPEELCGTSLWRCAPQLVSTVALPGGPEDQTDPRTNRSGVCFSRHPAAGCTSLSPDR